MGILQHTPASLPKGVSAITDSVPPDAETVCTAEVQMVTVGCASGQCESRHVASMRKTAAPVRDEPTSNQAKACTHREQ